MFSSNLLGLALLLALIVAGIEGQRKNDRIGFNRHRQVESDQFPVDSYSEIYKSTTRGKVPPPSFPRLNDDEGEDDEDDDEEVDGSGDGTNFDDDEDDDYESEEIGSGAYPTEFDPKGDFKLTSTSEPPSRQTTTRSTISRSTTASTSDLVIDEDDTENDNEDEDDDSDGDVYLQGSGSGDFGSDDEDYDDIRSKSTSPRPIKTSTTTTPSTTTSTTERTIAQTTKTSTSPTTSTLPRQPIATTESPSLTSTATYATTITKRTRPTFSSSTTPRPKTGLEDLNPDDGIDISLGQNHIIGILLYSGVVFVLCLAILISLCLILRRKSGYSFAGNSDEGSSSDSGSSDLPIIKQNSIIKDSKSHYARRNSPGSPPPLMPPDLTLDENFLKGDKPFGSYGKRKSPSRLKSSAKYY